MRNGKLRHRITIQEIVIDRDSNGGVITSWVDWGKAWASIEPLSVRDFIAANAEQSEVTARITMRYREGMQPTMRIIHNGKIYHMAGILPDPKSGIEYFTIPVKQGANEK